VVTYNGILPDTMAPGRELVVEGVLAGTGNNFKASEILTKCPSKYEETARNKGGR
jgi:cytochrome c-type biogenesis protein CcmE